MNQSFSLCNLNLCLASTTQVHLIDKDGNHSSHLLGDTLKYPECRYYVAVPHDTWYAAEIMEGAPYVLYSAVVAPGGSRSVFRTR